MSKSSLSWLLLLLLGLIWGSSFILMKRGMFTEDGTPIFSDIQVGALRMAIASLVMLPFGIRNWNKIRPKKMLFFLAIVGFFGNFFPAFLFTFAETQVASGLAGILNSFTSFFTILIGYFIFKQAVVGKQIVGLSIAFIGICALVGNSVFSQGNTASFLHVGAIVLATLMYGTSLNTIKHKLHQFTSLEIASLAFTILFIPAWIAFFISDVPSVFYNHTKAMEALGYIAILSVVGTCLALLIFNWIIALKSAVFASSVTYIIPIVAVFFGVWLNKESLEWIQVLGMVVTVLGVYLANNALKVKAKK